MRAVDEEHLLLAAELRRWMALAPLPGAAERSPPGWMPASPTRRPALNGAAESSPPSSKLQDCAGFASCGHGSTSSELVGSESCEVQAG